MTFVISENGARGAYLGFVSDADNLQWFLVDETHIVQVQFQILRTVVYNLVTLSTFGALVDGCDQLLVLFVGLVHAVLGDVGFIQRAVLERLVLPLAVFR